MLRPLALVLLVALAAGCKPREDEAIAPPGSGNGAVIEALRDAGSDMAAPHQLEFYAYFPSRDAADRASKAAAGKGYKTSVIGPDDDDEFELLAVREAKLEEAAINAMELELDAIAKAEQGYYDAWEAAVVE